MKNKRSRKSSQQAVDDQVDDNVVSYDHEKNQDISAEAVNGDGASKSALAYKKVLCQIIKDLSADDNSPFMERLKNMNLDVYSTSKLSAEKLGQKLIDTTKTVVEHMTLCEVLTVAINNPVYWSAGHKLSAYHLFLKDYHKRHQDIPFVERRQNAVAEFNRLHPKDKMDTGVIENVPITKVTPRKAASASTPVKSASKTKTARAKKESKSSQESITSKALNDSVVEKTKTKPYDCFVQDRRAKFGKEKAEVVRAAYANLPIAEKVQYIYRAMQLSDTKFNKSSALPKQDQELLNAHENKPVHPGTAYTLFRNEMHSLPRLASLSYQERMKVIGSMWKELRPDEKQPYEATNLRRRQDYFLKYNDYLAKLPEFRRKQELQTRGYAKPKELTKSTAASDSQASQPAAEHEVNVLADKALYLEDVEAVAKPKKRRIRSQTVDCSKIQPMDFLELEMRVPETPQPPPPPLPVEKTPEKNLKRKANEMSATKPATKAATPKVVAAKKKKVEPVKPPESVKQYFKSIYKGDSKEASKAFKRLSAEEKHEHYEQLKSLSDQYIIDFTAYLQSLTKEEMTAYMKKLNN